MAAKDKDNYQEDNQHSINHCQKCKMLVLSEAKRFSSSPPVSWIFSVATQQNALQNLISVMLRKKSGFKLTIPCLHSTALWGPFYHFATLNNDMLDQLVETKANRCGGCKFNNIYTTCLGLLITKLCLLKPLMPCLWWDYECSRNIGFLHIFLQLFKATALSNQFNRLAVSIIQKDRLVFTSWSELSSPQMREIDIRMARPVNSVGALLPWVFACWLTLSSLICKWILLSLRFVDQKPRAPT